MSSFMDYLQAAIAGAIAGMGIMMLLPAKKKEGEEQKVNPLVVKGIGLVLTVAGGGFLIWFFM
ncbi:MAG: hypothetical protein FWC79_05570 [Oscillospiraceae bacterium]|nr:hypothetical protein [Oscillospiraceae bacterium]